MRVARELYIEHGWTMPRGLSQTKASDPFNFTLADWQQAKRTGQDPRTIKAALQDAWAISDSKAALIRALDERGFKLARGDTKAFVVVDRHGEVYSLPRQIGLKTKEVRARVGDGDDLPDVAGAKVQIAQDIRPALFRLRSEALTELRGRNVQLRKERHSMRQRHREAREALSQAIEARRWEEARIRQSRFRTGVKGLWDWVRGENQRIRERNKAEAREAALRDRAEKDALIFAQLEERRRMIDLRQEIARSYADKARDIRDDLRSYRDMSRSPSRQKIALRKRNMPQA